MDINDKIATHKGLIYKQLHAFQLLYDQDAESDAYEALHRAILTFDSSTGAAFSTYAVCVINNALRKHLRTLSRKRQLEVTSYYEPVAHKDKELPMIDVLVQNESVEDLLLSNEKCDAIRKAVYEEYSLLSEKHKCVIRTFYNDTTLNQQGIAKAANVTQATVSKIISAFRYRVKLRLEELINE